MPREAPVTRAVFPESVFIVGRPFQQVLVVKTTGLLTVPRGALVLRRAQAHRRLERDADAVILSAGGARRSPDNGNNRRGDHLPFQPPACTHTRPWGRRS